MGSLNETESLLIVAHKLGFINDEAYLSAISKTEELGRILNGLKGYLRE